jgi:outer membrane protein assembly factor BamE (lipoprotein component of BamABCDE complex)
VGHKRGRRILGLVYPAIKAGRGSFKEIFFTKKPGKAKKIKTGEKTNVRTTGPQVSYFSELTKGVTNKKQVIDWFGQPSHKVMFTELEAWTYMFETTNKAQKEIDANQGQGFHQSCIILFKGNLVADYSIQVFTGSGPTEK